MSYECIIAHAKTIFDIPLSYYKSLGIKAVVSDLDQTLASSYSITPDEKVFAFRDSLKEESFRLLVISNNPSNRVKEYCETLQVPFISNARKYRKGKILRFLIEEGLQVKDCVFIGDQIYTDAVYVSKLKGRMILVDPLTTKDNLITRISRKKQEKIKQKLLLQNKLGVDLTPEGKEKANVL